MLYGITYVLFSRAQRFELALLFIFLSRAGMAINSVLNYSYLLRTVANRYRGRVFATIETFTWTMMMVSMMGAGIASMHYEPAPHRHRRGAAEFDDGGLLGLGELDGSPSAACFCGVGAAGG